MTRSYTSTLVYIALLSSVSVPVAKAESCFWDSSYECQYRRWERHREYERWIRRQDYYAAKHHEGRRDRRDEERCKPAIRDVVGDADLLKEAARRSAIHVWQNIVVHQFGERWMDYDSAEIIDEHYDVAGHGGDVITNTKRFVITARPCLRRSNADTGQ